MIKAVPKYRHIFGKNIDLNQCKQTCIVLVRCNGTAADEKTEQESKKTAELPEEPTTCCMSGCPNCVWLEYADKLTAYFEDGGEKAIKEINKKVQDSNIKAFLLHELRMRNK